MSETLEKLPAETERITNIVKNKDWNPVLAESEERSKKVSEKLQALKDRAETKKKQRPTLT